MSTDGTTCTCGHAVSFHQHFRHGSDCGSCGRSACKKYTPAVTASSTHGRDPDAPANELSDARAARHRSHLPLVGHLRHWRAS